MGISLIIHITEGASFWRLTEQLLQVQIRETIAVTSWNKPLSLAEQKIESEGCYPAPTAL